MKLSELVSKHLWGCAVGWGTKEQQADIEFQKQWCNCGILEARAEYAAQQSAQDGEGEEIDPVAQALRNLGDAIAPPRR